MEHDPDHQPTSRETHHETEIGSGTSSKAAALHFGGVEGERNMAVQAPVVARIVEAHGGS